MSVVSPAMKLTDAGGRSFTGQIELLIRTTQQKLTEFQAGNAVAVMDSQKITYSKPTQTQRANTYLSFLQYATASGGLNGVYITGDFGYTKDQAVPLVDINKADPIISLVFNKCLNDTCTKVTPAAITASSWSDASFSDPLLNMLKSFAIT